MSVCNMTEPYVREKKETATENSVSKFRDDFYFLKNLYFVKGILEWFKGRVDLCSDSRMDYFNAFSMLWQC